jgi:hypothetical protein
MATPIGKSSLKDPVRATQFSAFATMQERYSDLNVEHLSYVMTTSESCSTGSVEVLQRR